MYEFTEESFEKVIGKLSQEQTIQQISQFVANKVNGTLSITFPKTPSEKFTITFLLKTEKVISLFEIGEIMDFICNILQYEKVIVELDKAFSESNNKKLFADNTTLSQENANNINLFLKNHYPQFYNNVVEVNLGKQKDYFTIFSEKDSSPIEERKRKFTEEFIAYLKANEALWSRLISSADTWDTLQLQVKEELIKNSPRHKPQIPPSGSSVPV